VDLSVANSSEAPRLVHERLEEFASAHALPRAVVFAADMALEEHLTNILRHGGDAAAGRAISVRLELGGDELRIEVTDEGREFNPLNAPLPPLDRPPDERPIGGLGVHLMRKLMDRLDYTRRDGRNVLRMAKRIGGEAAKNIER